MKYDSGIFAVSLLASIVGSICGIGGGVIIKPVLDAMNVMSVSCIQFSVRVYGADHVGGIGIQEHACR